jgi:hypothetical protein
MTAKDYILYMADDADVQRQRRTIGCLPSYMEKIYDAETTRLAAAKWDRLVYTLRKIVQAHRNDKEFLDQLDAFGPDDLDVDVDTSIIRRRQKLESIIIRDMLKAGGFTI